MKLFLFFLWHTFCNSIKVRGGVREGKIIMNRGSNFLLMFTMTMGLIVILMTMFTSATTVALVKKQQRQQAQTTVVTEPVQVAQADQSK